MKALMINEDNNITTIFETKTYKELTGLYSYAGDLQAEGYELIYSIDDDEDDTIFIYMNDTDGVDQSIFFLFKNNRIDEELNKLDYDDETKLKWLTNDFIHILGLIEYGDVSDIHEARSLLEYCYRENIGADINWIK